MTGTLDRTTLRTIQTPQAFHFAPLLDAHRRAEQAGRDDFTDDAALAEWAGIPVAVFEGEAENIKMTTADDFNRITARAERREVALGLLREQHSHRHDPRALDIALLSLGSRPR